MQERYYEVAVFRTATHSALKILTRANHHTMDSPLVNLCALGLSVGRGLFCIADLHAYALSRMLLCKSDCQ